jgi:hypothetical protein
VNANVVVKDPEAASLLDDERPKASQNVRKKGAGRRRHFENLRQ